MTCYFAVNSACWTPYRQQTCAAHTFLLFHRCRKRGRGAKGLYPPHIVQMIKSNYFKLHYTRDIIAYNVILIKAKDIIA